MKIELLTVHFIFCHVGSLVDTSMTPYSCRIQGARCLMARKRTAIQSKGDAASSFNLPHSDWRQSRVQVRLQGKTGCSGGKQVKRFYPQNFEIFWEISSTSYSSSPERTEFSVPCVLCSHHLVPKTCQFIPQRWFSSWPSQLSVKISNGTTHYRYLHYFHLLGKL